MDTIRNKSKECFYCDGKGEYSFPEAFGTDGSDGWYKCEMCNGTGLKPIKTLGPDLEMLKPDEFELQVAGLLSKTGQKELVNEIDTGRNKRN